MAKTKTTKKVTETKASAKPTKVYNINEIVKFKANGKAKTLLDGQVYEIHGEMANLFLEMGYGEVIE